MDFTDLTLWKLIASCGAGLIVKFWFDYNSGRSLPEMQHDDETPECDEPPCLLQGPAPSA